MAAFAAFRDSARSLAPEAAVVLGSGLGPAVERISIVAEAKFGDLPGFAVPTVHGHGGRAILGHWAGVPVLVFQGRMHFYEGHTWERATATVRLAAELGVRKLLLTNAAGGICDDLHPGDLMPIRDHLKLLDRDAWKRPAEPISVYSPRLLALLPETFTGTYAALTGPTYETPAEIRALKAMGADAVGMSTAVEAETAAKLGLEVAAISCITNKAAGLSSGVLDHSDVQHVAGQPEVVGRMANLLERLIVEGGPGIP
ncbi:purine-nucleoside phosphorylase [Limnoglobus roseus]|uniref:purine-nucleoside phosphorylase n=1 Tax=Limnoglobus roseus TaxID=2598579 RepID=A0A5C1ANJ9_9BACT|nr:purine-nucleoside phosphorylase [Limnoglobus roseus]QEL20979.1 purine-nucleoside phosphorylase [Limnoglobus roseus]